MPFYNVLHGAMRAWGNRVTAEEAMLPHPRDEAVVSSPGPDPIRVLLVGSGPFAGFGVTTHELALTGQLARAVTRRFKRGCSVEYVGQLAGSAAATVTTLSERTSLSFDVAFVAFGVVDAATLTPRRQWERQIRVLLAVLTSGLSGAEKIMIAVIPDMRSVPLYGGLQGQISQIHAHRLNTWLRTIAASTPHCTTIDLPRPRFDIGRPTGSADLYERLAEFLVTRVTQLPAGNASQPAT